MAGFLSTFSFVTATTIQQLKNSSNNENTVKSTTLWLSVWKKCFLEKRIPKEIENYEPTQLKCHSRQERSSRLPVGKKFSFIFCPCGIPPIVVFLQLTYAYLFQIAREKSWD